MHKSHKAECSLDVVLIPCNDSDSRKSPITTCELVIFRCKRSEGFQEENSLAHCTVPRVIAQ